MKKRFKNIYFYIGIIGTVFSAANVDPSTMTDWNILFDFVKSIYMNPWLLGWVSFSVIGVIVDNTTSGAKDCKEKEQLLNENKILKEKLEQFKE